MSETRRPDTPVPQLVLIVEEDEHTREMYAEWLRFSGFRVEEAKDGSEAIEKTRTLNPDVITTDIGLRGGMDGCQLAASLKSCPQTYGIPVIAVTGWAMGGHLERARQAGCDAVLIKPCLPETLLAEILRLLNVLPRSVQESGTHVVAKGRRLLHCSPVRRRSPVRATHLRSDTRLANRS